MSDLLKLLEEGLGQTVDKPGPTSSEIMEELGLDRHSVAKILKKAVLSGQVKTVSWIDTDHWSGRPRPLICYVKAK